MPPAKPSLDLLRSLTDEHVIRALIARPRLTRAEIALHTGISKPTVGESVRRLTEGGLLRDTGERTTGRGRIGTYYALAGDLGTAVVVSIAPEGVTGEAIDIHGQVVARDVAKVGRPALSEQVGQALQTVASRVAMAGKGPARLAVVSAADPVDRTSGRLVHVPDAPFLVGELSPAELLAPVISGPVTVDNDVNWAARAERAAATPGAAETLDDFAYLYLGSGLGGALMSDGEVRRGHDGLAGEIAHILTHGPGGRAMRFTEVFAELGLRQPDSTAVDVGALLNSLNDPQTLETVTHAISGIITTLVALADPQVIVLGGPWGTHPALVQAVAGHPLDWDRPVAIRAAHVTTEAPLTGARHQALRDLQSSILDQSSRDPSRA